MDYPCICISLRQASRKMTALYDEALQPSGINLAQFSLLRKISRNGPLSLTALGELTELDRSTLGRNVRVLGRLGLVELTGGEDKREAAVALSDAGRRVLADAVPRWQGVQETIYAKLGVTGADQLQALLATL